LLGIQQKRRDGPFFWQSWKVIFKVFVSHNWGYWKLESCITANFPHNSRAHPFLMIYPQNFFFANEGIDSRMRMCVCERGSVRVARFLLVQHTKTEEYAQKSLKIPNVHKIYKNAEI
jgi:hypothetical protein